MGIKGLWKDFERTVKDVRGKDVPESPLRGHESLTKIIEGISEMIEGEAIELAKDAAEAGWEAIKGIQVAGIVITRELYDAVVRAIVDQIIDLGGDK